MIEALMKQITVNASILYEIDELDIQIAFSRLCNDEGWQVWIQRLIVDDNFEVLKIDLMSECDAMGESNDIMLALDELNNFIEMKINRRDRVKHETELQLMSQAPLMFGFIK